MPEYRAPGRIPRGAVGTARQRRFYNCFVPGSVAAGRPDLPASSDGSPGLLMYTVALGTAANTYYDYLGIGFSTSGGAYPPTTVYPTLASFGARNNTGALRVGTDEDGEQWWLRTDDRGTAFNFVSTREITGNTTLNCNDYGKWISVNVSGSATIRWDEVSGSPSPDGYATREPGTWIMLYDCSLNSPVTITFNTDYTNTNLTVNNSTVPITIIDQPGQACLLMFDYNDYTPAGGGNLYVMRFPGWQEHYVFGDYATYNANASISENITMALVNTNGGAVTLTLPLAATRPKRFLHVKKTTSDANGVTIQGYNTTQKIDGANTVTIGTGSPAMAALALYCEGSNWFIAGNY